jgi:hypothetical protein
MPRDQRFYYSRAPHSYSITTPATIDKRYQNTRNSLLINDLLSTLITAAHHDACWRDSMSFEGHRPSALSDVFQGSPWISGVLRRHAAHPGAAPGKEVLR